LNTTPGNVDPAELSKFAALAQSWWDPKGPSKPLHDLNPLRLNYLQRIVPLEHKQVLDVGCGGGILSESMARAGARVLGIDLAQAVLDVAELHALDAKVDVSYRAVSAEDLALERPAAFDVVTCMEMLEHVPDPAATLAALRKLVKPGGHVIVSTLNRSLKAFAVAIIGTQALGDIVNILYGHTIQGAVGVMIASALLFYMTRPSIRGCFVAMPKQIVRSQDP